MTGCFHSEGYGFDNWTEDIVKLRRTWIDELNTLYLFEVEFIATKLKRNLLLQSDEGLQKYQILPWSEGDAGTLCKVLFAGSRRSLIDDWNWDPGLASLICVFGWPKERESPWLLAESCLSWHYQESFPLNQLLATKHYQLL